MPILKPTGLTGHVAAVLINADAERDLTTSPLDRVRVTYAGFEGGAHSGLTRLSCVRVKAQYPVGTEIRNTRQISILSSEELTEIGETMGLGEPVRPEWVGANLAVSGMPKLTEIPPSSGQGLMVPEGRPRQARRHRLGRAGRRDRQGRNRHVAHPAPAQPRG